MVPELSPEAVVLRKFFEVLDQLVTQVEVSEGVDRQGNPMRNLAVLREARDLIHDPEIRRLAGRG